MTDEEWLALGIPPPPPPKAEPDTESRGGGFPPFALLMLAIIPVLAGWALTR